MRRIISPESAAKTLGAIRLVNGAAALMLPATMAKKMGVDPEANKGALYVLRLFGIRTVLIGLQLLKGSKSERQSALRVALLIHGSDTLAAIVAGLSGHLPKKAAKTATIISGVNTGLAAFARSR
ncbi:MAG TPA: hypothetical protein VND22_02170 [Actinomycetota bacterium]|nr:hypothetical protein [Actinomycetota bacterium]